MYYDTGVNCNGTPSCSRYYYSFTSMSLVTLYARATADEKMCKNWKNVFRRLQLNSFGRSSRRGNCAKSVHGLCCSYAIRSVGTSLRVLRYAGWWGQKSSCALWNGRCWAAYGRDHRSGSDEKWLGLFTVKNACWLESDWGFLRPFFIIPFARTVLYIVPSDWLILQ